MTGMIAEINAASNKLHSALDQYLRTCSAIRDSYSRRGALGDVPTELMNCVLNELTQITLYEAKFQQAKANIAVARNGTPAIVPIHILPTEILVRIFHLAIDLRCRSNVKSRSRKVTSPINLSHVCSRWREILIEASSLWSHIDFSLSGLFNHGQGSIPYSEVSMARSKQSMLELHIVDRMVSSRLNTTGFVQFLAPIATRIRSLSLELGADLSPGQGSVLSPILFHCFANCVPGTLRQLHLLQTSSRVNDACTFIMATGSSSPHGPRDILLGLSEQRLENLWHSVSVLQLRGLYPPWTSKAYHGLVELRLHSFRSSSITELQLVAILASSPGLRILEVGLELTEPLPTDSSIIPVRLNDLETLTTEPSQRGRLGGLPRLLAPGLKPLQVSILNSRYRVLEGEERLTDGKLEELFARSNVTCLYVGVLNGYSQAIKLLSLVPRGHLPVLGVNHLIGGGIESLDALGPDISLNSFYMRSGTAQLDQLEQFIRRCQVQTFTLRRCNLNDVDGHTTILRENFQNRLSNICPVFKLLSDDEPGPFEDYA